CQTAAEYGQYVGGGFKFALFVLQASNIKCQRLPIEFTKVTILVQLAQGSQLLLQRSLFLLQQSNTATQLRNLRLQGPRLVLQRGNLGFIAPAEHVTAAVIDAMAIILFVPLPRRLDLPVTSDGPGFATELFLISAAGHIKAVTYF